MYMHTHDKQHLNEFKYNSIANIEKTMTVYVFFYLMQDIQCRVIAGR